MGKQTLKFENVGMGIALASDWFVIDGKRYWISFMSTSEGRGHRRTWHVRATHYPKNDARNGPGWKADCSKRDCFRYEAADEALAALIDHIRANQTEAQAA